MMVTPDKSISALSRNKKSANQRPLRSVVIRNSQAQEYSPCVDPSSASQVLHVITGGTSTPCDFDDYSEHTIQPLPLLVFLVRIKQFDSIQFECVASW